VQFGNGDKANEIVNEEALNEQISEFMEKKQFSESFND